MNASPRAKYDGSIDAPIISSGLTNNPQIEYSPRSDTTLEVEAEALAAVYAFLIECYENRKAAESGPGVEGGDADGE